MNDEVLVKVEGVSKKFCKDFKTSLKYGVKDVFTNLRGKSIKRELRSKEFWALRDINFELRRGECLGLIGQNGAGKSTLLKILNGLILPDSGKVTMKGRVGALIELGAGFNPILTGKENIYNNGAVLGFRKKEIDNKLDAIIDFAEIHEFIDMPVQNYSSGMKVRLGFAIASQMEPDILIIDEVLAVGDISFRAKCYKRISELMNKCCVIFVSHNMPQISKICTSVKLLKGGSFTSNGSIGEVIEEYYNINNEDAGNSIMIAENFELIKFQLDSKKISNFEENFNIQLILDSKVEFENIELNIVILSRELAPVYQGSSRIMKQQVPIHIGLNEVNFKILNLSLNTGFYNLSFTIDNIVTGEKYYWHHNVEKIHVSGEHVGISPALLQGKWTKTN